MIKRIKIINWTSHSESEIKFGRSNVLIGHIGSGKSSVVEAISYLLFGSFPALRERELNIKDVIRRGEKKAVVEGEFLINGKNYLIRREIKSNGSSAKLYVEGKLISESPSIINEFITNETGIDAKSFSNTIYASQNKLDEIVELSPSERRKLIDELINIERLEKAHKNAISLSNRIARELKFYREQVEGEEESKIREEIIKEKETLESEEIKSKKAREELKKIKDEKNSYEREYKEEKLKREKKEAIENKLKKLEGILESLKEYEDKKIDEKVKDIMEEEREKLKSIKKELNEIEKNYVEVIGKTNRLNQLLEEEEKKRKELNEIEKRIKLIELKDIKKLKEIKDRMEEIITLEKQILNSAKENLNKIGEGKGVCPVCLRPLGKEREKLELHWKEEIEKANKVIAGKVKELMEVKKEIEKNERLEKEVYSLMKRKESIELRDIEKIKKLKEVLKKKESEIRQKKEEKERREEEVIKKIEVLKKKEEENKRIEEKKRFLENVKKEIIKLREEGNRISFNKQKMFELEAKIKKLYNEMGEKQGYLNNIEKLLNAKKRLIKEKEGKLKKIIEIKNKMNKLSFLWEDVNLAKAVIEKTQEEARKNLLESINISLNALWNLLYPYKDYIKVEIRAKGNSYTFLAFNGREWLEIERVFSGGERSIFVLSLRLAIASVVMNKLNFIVLDEPTHNLDENAVIRFGEVIDKELPSMIGQFIIVTHDERLRNIENGRILYFDRDKESDDPTKVREV